MQHAQFRLGMRHSQCASGCVGRTAHPVQRLLDTVEAAVDFGRQGIPFVNLVGQAKRFEFGTRGRQAGMRLAAQRLQFGNPGSDQGTLGRQFAVAFGRFRVGSGILLPDLPHQRGGFVQTLRQRLRQRVGLRQAVAHQLLHDSIGERRGIDMIGSRTHGADAEQEGANQRGGLACIAGGQQHRILPFKTWRPHCCGLAYGSSAVFYTVQVRFLRWVRSIDPISSAAITIAPHCGRVGVSLSFGTIAICAATIVLALAASCTV